MCYIYEIKCIENNKNYIGQTIKNPNDRWSAHKYELKNNIHSNTYLQNCWNKYGENKFQFEIIESCDNLENLNIREKELILEYKSHVSTGEGFNLKYGGNNSRHCEESIQKMSGENHHMYGLRGEDNPNYGRKNNKETLKRMSEAQSGKNNPMYNKTHDDKTKRKISQSSKNRNHTEESKKKIGDKVKEYYKNNANPRSKKVEQYDLDGNLLNNYSSIREAGRKTDLNSSHISKVCRGKRNTCGGYKWKYKN